MLCGSQLLKFEILQTTWKNKTKQKHQNARSIDEKLKTKSLMLYMIPACNQIKTVHMYKIHWIMTGLQKLQMLVAARESQEKEIR